MRLSPSRCSKSAADAARATGETDGAAGETDGAAGEADGAAEFDCRGTAVRTGAAMVGVDDPLGTADSKSIIWVITIVSTRKNRRRFNPSDPFQTGHRQHPS